MPNYWFKMSTVGGSYDPKTKGVILDYSSSIDPSHAQAVLAHEAQHASLCALTDFGQTSYIALNLVPKFTHFNEEEKKKVLGLIRAEQFEVQEGLATLLQAAVLRSKIGKQATLKWANEKLTPEYKVIFDRLSFLLSVGSRYREEFLQKAGCLAMETGIRK